MAKGIGIRSIWSQSGTARQDKKPAPQRVHEDDGRDDDASERGPPPAPGTGVLVDLRV